MTNLVITQACIGIGGSVFALYLLHIVYGVFWEKRKVNKFVWPLFYIFFIVSCFIVELQADISMNIISSIIRYFLAACLYENRITNRILVSMMYFVIGNGIETACGFFLSTLFQQEFSHLLQTNILFYLCGVIISKMLLFMAVKIIETMKLYNMQNLPVHKVLPIVLLSLSSIMVAFIIMDVSSSIVGWSNEVAAALCLLLLSGSNIYVVYLVGRQAELEHTKQMLAFLEEESRMQIEHYQEIYENQKEIRSIRHDLKHTLLAISGMLQEGKTDEALEYLYQTSGELQTKQVMVETHIGSLNAVLSAKRVQAQKYDIIFSVQSSHLYLQIDELDFCVLIANALDNALEACQRLNEGIDKFIILKIQQTALYLTIEVRNPYNENENNKQLSTWKSDAKNHGYGIESMNSIAKKYDGIISIKRENGEFLLSILVKNKAI